MFDQGVASLSFDIPIALKDTAEFVCPLVIDKKSNGHDLKVIAWSQKFTHSSMGFGGMGHNGTTNSHIIVVYSGSLYSVYFGGRFGYALMLPTDSFMEQLKLRNLPTHNRFKKDPQKWCKGEFILGE